MKNWDIMVNPISTPFLLAKVELLDYELLSVLDVDASLRGRAVEAATVDGVPVIRG